MTDPSSGGTPPPPVPPPGAEGGPPPGPEDGGRPPATTTPPPPPGSGRQEPDPSPDSGRATPHPEVVRPGLDDRERALDPKVVNVWRVTGALLVLLPFLVLVPVGFVMLGRWGWLAVLLALGLLWLRVWWYPPARYARWRWQLSSLALELRYGVLVRQYEAVPYFRIQQIDITQGPIDRLLGLATLVVTTASASGSATLPGIAADDAPPVRAELLARAAEAVAEHPGDLQDAV